MFGDYLKDVEKTLAAGYASEGSHYPALKLLIELQGAGITATSLPRRIQCGAPDFIITKDGTTIGYIEAKDVDKPLDDIEKGKGPDGERFKRYLSSLTNIILTNYLEFRWYVDGERRLTALLGKLTNKARIKRYRTKFQDVAELLSSFLAHKAVTIGTPKDLALRMARFAHMIRNLIINTFDNEPESGSLHAQLGAFRDNLIPDLSVEQFADMYAQTIVYGLFAARCTSSVGDEFGRQNATYLLPRTNPFLRKLFNHIAGPDLDDPIAWLVDDLAQVLAQADMTSILRDFGKRVAKEDPVVHFYETFLAAYDPKVREMRGVYYTPEPVVSYIVRSIDHLLKSRFDKHLGLVDPGVLILDPAAGTATFLYMVVNEIRKAFTGQEGMWNDYVAHKLLPRLFGFELLMAPYAIAHLKLGLRLQETDYQFESEQRLGIYLTNTLEEAFKHSETLFAQWITEESNAAAKIKKDEPIMVVLGNPPYSGHSANRTKVEVELQPGQTYIRNLELKVIEDSEGKQKAFWSPNETKATCVTRKCIKTFIGRLIEDYKIVDNRLLDEKNPKWLQDDYVKFIRFGEWRIGLTGKGILSFITNHAYLDNPTFRGMRQSLMNSFSDIYILNLHGNAKRKEVAPDGGKDENVFDIQQGVAIGLFVKEMGKSSPAKVHYSELWGLRDGKYRTLIETDINTTKWTELKPVSPFYLFVPVERELLNEYEEGWKVTDIFPTSSVGIVTARDKLTIHWSKKEVEDTTHDFTLLSSEEAREEYDLGDDVQDWKVSLAQKDLKDSGLKSSLIVDILYRPFDVRFTYYTGRSRGFHCRPRTEVMRHMAARENLGLITVRQVAEGVFDHVFVSRSIVESRITLSNKGIGFLFPLYLYPIEEKEQPDKSGGSEGGVQAVMQTQTKLEPNLNPRFIKTVSDKLGLRFVSDGKGDLTETFGPEDVFSYAYAVLHSCTYRNRYAEFLKMDFPRIPITADKELFKTLTEIGVELISLHLIESPTLNNLFTKYPVAGLNMVEKVTYDENAERIYINKEQYFEGVQAEIWNFHIGGYQVCEKWLKDRKDRALSYDELTHYQKIVVAITETTRLMEEIDQSIPSWPVE